MKNVMRATSPGVVDPHAVKIIERSGVRTRVVNAEEPKNLFEAVEKNIGTEIV